MIDKYFTDFQESIIIKANQFVTRDSGPYSGDAGKRALGRLENRIVMALGIVATSVIDYVKLPLAIIEQLALGIILIPFKPFSDCMENHKNAFLYTITLIPSKFVLGTINDIHQIYISLQSPEQIIFIVPPSYFGSGALYNKGCQTENEKNYPSIYKS